MSVKIAGAPRYVLGAGERSESAPPLPTSRKKHHGGGPTQHITEQRVFGPGAPRDAETLNKVIFEGQGKDRLFYRKGWSGRWEGDVRRYADGTVRPKEVFRTTAEDIGNHTDDGKEDLQVKMIDSEEIERALINSPKLRHAGKIDVLTEPYNPLHDQDNRRAGCTTVEMHQAQNVLTIPSEVAREMGQLAPKLPRQYAKI
jgi:hypothetical protein